MRLVKETLLDFDIFPKVVPSEKTVEITIKALGAHTFFDKDSYKLEICPMLMGTKAHYPHKSGFDTVNAEKQADGSLKFSYAFVGEQEHFIRICGCDMRSYSEKRKPQLSVYSIKEDLCGKYPFVGDLHMHTFRSDGCQSPAVVAANYRKHGYDFLGITDHQRYYGSLEAIDAYKKVKTEYTLIPGEEVHLPNGDENHINDVHIVNFGGKYSINGLFSSRDQVLEKGSDNAFRSIGGVCPEPMSDEDYFKMIDEFKETIDIPDGVEPFSYASCLWIFREIKKAGGLGIFAHPYWISNVYQVPEALSEALFASKEFDAFEVLGGENYFQQNGFQSIFYYEQAAKGNRVPIVGSTDSHNSHSNNQNAFICSTMVFAEKNEREDLINSIKNYYSVAIDTISDEYRMVGELRLVKYADFLYNNFFPLHDELCFEEGRLMFDYSTGDEDAAHLLSEINGRMKKQREKYFAF